MTNNAELAEFLEELRDEVCAKVSLDDSSSNDALEAAFTELVADELAEYGAVEGLIPCLLNEKTGKGLVRVNGYYINDDRDRLDLFVTFYRGAEGGATLTQTDVRQAFERGRRVLQLISEGRDLGDKDSSDQAAMVAAIRDAADKIREVQVIVISDCPARDTTELKEPFGDRVARCVIWDVNRLLRVRNSGRPYEAIEIDVREYCNDRIPLLAMPQKDASSRTYLGILPGNFLYRLYDEYGPRLLQLNVRSFLQVRGNVNKGIRDTIINEPSRFLAYNNGLTATVESLKYDTDENGQSILTQLTGFQVVNGGQTIATIHHTAKKDCAPLNDVLVQVKISSVGGKLLDELVPKISRYANTQNRVNEADFSSNDPFHVTLEELSERIWAPGETNRWFYERARGQYQVAKARYGTTPANRKKFGQEMPTSKKYAKTDLAKYVNSWGQQPHVVSKGAQKNFIAMMDSIGKNDKLLTQDERWYKRLIAQAIIFKRAESISRRLNIPAYRANAITYTVALISYRTQQRLDLDAIWESQSVSDALEKTIETWMPLVHRELVASANGRNVTEWCKKADCWRHIQMMEISLPSSLEAELAEGQPLPNVGRDAKIANITLTSQDRENLAKVMMVPDGVWLDIHRWGIENGNLKEFQCGIAHTLVAYAAGGWSKVPSRKQARHAVEIIGEALGHVPSLNAVMGNSQGVG